jgi:PAS domain S-box-containing protein
VCLWASISHSEINETDILTPGERKWLIENQSRIVFAVETNYQPFVFSSDDGQTTGLAHEYMLLLEKKLGVHFRQRRFSSLDDIFDTVRTGEVHIVNAVTETPWRSTFLNFTSPYIKVPNVMIVRKEREGIINEDTLGGLRVSLVKNYAVTEYLMKKKPGLTAKMVPDDLSALLDVSFGRSDVAIIDLASASYLISQKNIANLRVAGKAEMDIALAIGTPKNETVLNEILKKGSSAISESERKKILNRWIYSSEGVIFTDWRFWAISGGILSIILIIVAGVFIWNLTLRKQVAIRTQALQNKTDALQLSEESLKRAASAGSVGLWDWDLKDGKIFYSHEWKAQIGFEDHEIDGCYDEWEKRLHPDDLDRTLSVLNNSLNPPWPPYEVEFRLRHKDGSYRWIHAKGNFAMDEQNKPLRMMGTHLDITERKKSEEEKASLEAQLHQIQKIESVGRLAGGVAHDFNNMLGVIIGHTEIARDLIEPSHPICEDLEEISKAAERSADLTRQLLAFARKQTIRPAILDINDRITTMLKMLRRLVGEQIDLDWVPGFEVWPVKIDSSQLDQILTNLFVNARDAIEGSGRISIQTENRVIEEGFSVIHPESLPGSYVRLSVKDTGKGMESEILEKIFEPFFTTKGLGEGTGLGLSTVYGAVKQNSGFITVESKIGEGSEFAIYLPKHSDGHVLG